MEDDLKKRRKKKEDDKKKIEKDPNKMEYKPINQKQPNWL